MFKNCLKKIKNYRNTDPVSSQLAGEHVELSGDATKQRQMALRAVVVYPGLTSRELAKECGLDRYMLARRLPEIKEIEKGELRICKEGKKLSLTWWPRKKENTAS